MTSTQSSPSSSKSRRSKLLPSFKFGSASSPRQMPSSSSTSVEPDYFGKAVDAQQESANAWSFGNPSLPAATPSVSTDSHPWTKMLGDGGMKTALPDMSKSSRLLPQQTPALNRHTTLTNTSSSSLPLDSSSAFNLPKVNSSKLTLPLSAKPKLSANQDYSRYKGLDIDGLAQALVPALSKPDSKDDVLILDIRPSTSFSSARVTSSINICAPSTLLKRPAITVERIEQEMLPSDTDKRRFMRWRKGPLKHKDAAPPAQSNDFIEPGINKIVVYDTDTSRIDGAGNATAGGGGACLIGMLKKFEAAGFNGELCWLVGGFNRLAHSQKASALIDTSRPSPDHVCPKQTDQQCDTCKSKSSPTYDRRADKPRSLTLSSLSSEQADDMPSSTAKKQFSLVQPRGLSLEAFQSQSTVAGWPGQAQAQAQAQSKFALENQLTVSQRPQGTRKLTGSACANPFFDNIRQNRELQHGITERIPMELPDMDETQINALPPFFQELVRLSSQDRAQMLAQGFFDVEKAEQNRLLATMEQHSALSEQGPQSNGVAHPKRQGQTGKQSHAFPFSIAAALERGADNRYNNIWTYEHSRVRLNKPQSEQDPGSDYLNGSHLVPATQFDSNRRYIATQAPLPTTFEAFWTAVWEQNSRVIVMLTREYESGRVQSHPYWLETTYGPSIRLDKLEETVLDQHGREMAPEECASLTKDDADNGQLFPAMVVNDKHADPQSKTPTTVRRIFRLRNLGERGAAVRRIVHLQYVAWPDYHIPDSPDSLLSFMDLADASQHAADSELRQLEREPARTARSSYPVAGPMVVHCSAGVGRTGAFIAINTALDVIRRCRRRIQGRSPLSPWDSDLPSRRASNVETPEVEMASSASQTDDTRSSRSERRSLKRDLSPAAMDVDSGSEPRSSREVASPSRMLRDRSSGSSDTDTTHSRLGVDLESRSSSTTDTSPASFQSMHLPQVAKAETFSNPFTSATFSFNPHAGSTGAGKGSASSPMQPSQSQGSGNESRLQSPPRLSAFANSSASSSEAWRQVSSPYSEVSTPSLQSGSARSSFSSATGQGSLNSLNSMSPGPNDSLRSVDSALAGINSFELAISRNKSRMTGPLSQPSSSDSKIEDTLMEPRLPAGHGDASTSTVTGSNEPTPFDFSSSSANAFGFARESGSDKTQDDSSDEEEDEALRLSLNARLSSSNLARRSSVANEAAAKADTAYTTGEDMIRKIVETAREQRMSLIQTGRQYVFVYSAVLTGLLHELQKEGIH